MWFIQNAERWRLEQEALKALKISFSVDEELEAQGFLRLDLEVADNAIIAGLPSEFLPLKLNVTFPDSYPFFRPTVYAADLDLPRHQNKIDKNLCLLPRSSTYWLPETTLAAFLEEQLPKVLTQGMITDAETLQQNPGEQAEPISEYYQAEINAPIIIDTEGFDTIKTNGKPIQHLGQIRLGIQFDRDIPGRILVLECQDEKNHTLSKLPYPLENNFKPSQFAAVYRTMEAPPTGDPEKDYVWINQLLADENEKIKKLKVPIRLKSRNTINNVIGITFPEEHLPGRLSHGWLFIVSGTFADHKKSEKKLQTYPFKYYAKANRINNTDLSFRIPSLKPLADKSIAVFGLGALGAPSVIEFAKNGIREIRIIDFDIVEAGTTVRWPLGISAAGLLKTDALEHFIQENYPYVEIKKFRYTVGGVLSSNKPYKQEELSNIMLLRDIISGVSMVYDATAETGINHFLSVEARKNKIPYLCAYATKGVFGGVIMRSGSDITEGCWMCFQYGLNDGTYPTPPVDESGSIQSAGCGDISFTGTSFELQNIVSAGVRLAVSTLCLNSEGYQNIKEDIGILSLVDENRIPVFPQWSSHKLQIHPQCPYCNTK